MRHCPICGVEVSSAADTRFGEAFCSVTHAGEFVEKIREAKIRAAVAPAVRSAEPEARHPETSMAAAPAEPTWKRYAKMGACVGAPLLALAFLAGGGGAVLGAAGALVPILAFLACPLAMYFMMRSMSKMGDKERRPEKGEEK
jgi:hypothetical protein